PSSGHRRHTTPMRSRSVLQTGNEPAPPSPQALDAAWSFLRHAPFGVIAVSREGTVLDINPAASKLLGYSAEEALGDAVARIFRAPRGESHVTPGACAAPEESRDVEAVTRSGDVLPLGLRLLPLEGREGALLGTLALFQDLREQNAQEEQWRR